MAVSATLSNHFKYMKATGGINLLTDSIKILLMRSGFTFNKDTHAIKKNVKTTSGSIGTLTFANTGNTLTRNSGSFITDGFVVGNQITTDSANSANQGPFLISVVDGSGLALTVTTTAGGDPTLTDGAESNITVTSNDELAAGYGYAADTKVLTGQAVAEDDTNDRSEMTCDSITWNASGGSIGPTPGAILYSDTSSDDTIIGYLNFDGDQTVPDSSAFTLSNVKVRDA